MANDKDSDNSSQKALNNLFQIFVSLQAPVAQKKSPGGWVYSGLEELRKLEVERDQKIKHLERFSSETSSFQSENEVRLAKLNETIESFKMQIKNLKPKQTRKSEEVKLLLRNDYLSIQIREWNLKIESIEAIFEILKKAHKNVVDSLSQVHLKNEYQDMIDAMRENLKNTNNDYYEAQSLLKELQKIAWSMLPPKVSQACEEIERQMELVKMKWEDVQFKLYKKHLQMSKMQKENLALNSALIGEFRIKELYEKKIESTLVVRNELKNKLNRINNRIGNAQRKLSWNGKSFDEELNRTNTMKSLKSSATLLSTSKESEESKRSIRRSFVGREDKLEFLKEKLVQIEKEINAANNEMQQQKKSFELLQGDLLELETIRSEIKKILHTRKLMATKLQQEIILRKTYYNQIEDLKGKIRVYCRCRPISQAEIGRGNKQCVSFPDVYTVAVNGGSRDKRGKEFQFDKVFTPNIKQNEVFKDTSILLQSAFDGFNVCIFAYGQTGSGKTFTLIGNFDTDPGIVPRAFERIFEIVHEGKVKFKAQIQCYILELYNEKLLDLLTADAVYSDKLEIKKDLHGMVMVPGAELISALDVVQLKELFLKGNSNRHIASTKMNSESSRSHLIISIIITCRYKNSDKIVRGKLSIIDLAGSERVGKSGVQGVGAQEAMSINMSLSALGDVISALTTGQVFVPYRNNKLTMLMQDSIGGNAKTLMFVNISPVDYNAIETMSSLTYGTRVKLIKNDASKVMDSDEVPKLQKIIESLVKGEEVFFN